MLFTLAGLVLPGAGLVLGFLALREIDRNAQVGGRGLAMTGTAASALGVLWCLTVVVILILRELMG